MLPCPTVNRHTDMCQPWLEKDRTAKGSETMMQVWVKLPAKLPSPVEALAEGEKNLGGTVGEREGTTSGDPKF